jgi:hypothetical protein
MSERSLHDVAIRLSPGGRRVEPIHNRNHGVRGGNRGAPPQISLEDSAGQHVDAPVGSADARRLIRVLMAIARRWRVRLTPSRAQQGRGLAASQCDHD